VVVEGLGGWSASLGRYWEAEDSLRYSSGVLPDSVSTNHVGYYRFYLPRSVIGRRVYVSYVGRDTVETRQYFLDGSDVGAFQNVRLPTVTSPVRCEALGHDRVSKPELDLRSPAAAFIPSVGTIDPDRDGVLGGDWCPSTPRGEPVDRVGCSASDDKPMHVHGTVTDSAGRPIRGVMVSADGVDLSQQTDSRGRFMVPLPKVSLGDPITLRAERLPWDQYEETRTVTKEDEEFIVELRRSDPGFFDIGRYLKSIRLYETGPNDSIGEERQYTSLFDAKASRFISIEFGFEHPAQGISGQAEIGCVFFKRDETGEWNRVSANISGTHSSDASRSGSLFVARRGREEPGFWDPGEYLVDCDHEGLPLGSVLFEVRDQDGPPLLALRSQCVASLRKSP
jgi:hypothetical protein